ncbi:MAG: pyruvate dehydrogenase complex dihydrolipoamide acetyltransferase [Planctomycetota bacterium]
MPIEITMPRLSDTMERGTVVAWHVKEGDAVSSGDVIADIETDKATMELEAFDDGTVAKLAVDEGGEADVGAIIMVIAEEGENVEEAAKAASKAGATASAKASAGGDAPASNTSSDTAGTAVADPAPSPDEPAPSQNGSRVFASPLARKIAGERGIDLAGITGSGPSGRIIKADVEAAATNGSTAATSSAETAGTASAPRPAAPAPMPLPPAGASLESKTVPLSNMRGTIAKRLVESKQTIPHYVVTVSARLDALTMLRKQLNEQLSAQGVRLSVNDFLVRACGLAMHEHPFVNSSWNASGGNGGPAIDLHGQVNVGVAVALPQERGGGLVVATIRDADRIGLRQISSETKRLAKKAREKGLSVDEMSDSTFTISNLGMFGVDHFTAIINPPNAAILAVGQAVEKVYVSRDEDGDPSFDVGTEMAMTMSSDHRIIDGAMAAQYLQSVKTLLENPATLLV